VSHWDGSLDGNREAAFCSTFGHRVRTRNVPSSDNATARRYRLFRGFSGPERSRLAVELQQFDRVS
jgi:hypothetical protein